MNYSKHVQTAKRVNPSNGFGQKAEDALASTNQVVVTK